MFDFAAHGLLPPDSPKDIPGGGPQTLGAVLERALVARPQATALVGRGGRFTYAQLNAAVERAAGALHALGLGRYDRLAACLPNDVDIVIALLACARLGAIWVGVNRPLAPPEKAFLLADSGARLYLTDAAGEAELAAERAALGALEQIVVVGDTAPAAAANWQTLLADAQPDNRPVASVDPYEPAAIAYTSGTTGRPKGAVHSHRNLLLPGAVAVNEGRFGPDCPQGVMLPLTILNLMVLAPLTAFQDTSTCICMHSLKPADIARWVRSERVGHFASVPTVIQDLLTAEEVDPGDLATLGQPDIGGAGIARSFQALYRERFGQRMTVAYGMTEAPTIVARTEGDTEPQEELCGRAVLQVALEVVDGNDHSLPPGEVGEICVRPARVGPYAGVYTPMLGYWNRPQETRATLRNGLYHSGDLGYLDAVGQLFIRGRLKELIIRGGANIYPAEIERALATHADVADSAVLGIPDARLGQRVVAAVQLHPQHAAFAAKEAARALAAALQAHCAQQIARYKVPAQIVFVHALPRNAMNKVVKPQLLPLFDATGNSLPPRGTSSEDH